VKYPVALLAVIAVATPPATAAQPSFWRGHTSQGYAMRAVVSSSGGLVTRLRTRYGVDCTDGSTVVRRLVLTREAGDTLAIGGSGRFSTSGTVASGLPGQGSGSLTYKVAGRLRNNRITGTLRVDYAFDSGVRCTSQLVGFTLRT
jgi:hypothetical protein